jgi:hypothetical protein
MEKKMKSKLIALFILFGLTNIAQAESQFDGTYVQLSFGYTNVNQNINHTDTYSTYNLSSSSFDDIKTLTSSIGAGYNWSINSKLIFGLGFEISPTTSSKANYTISPNQTALYLNPNTPIITGSTQLKNPWNFYVSPGYLINSNQLIYSKIGYTQAVGVNTNSQVDNIYKGYSIGLGYKQKFENKFYAYAEWNYANYDTINETTTASSVMSTNISKPIANNFMVGLGYTF